MKSSKKKEQIKLLKGLELTTDIFMGFILYAGDNGYLLSQYTSHHHANGIDEKELPAAYMKKPDGTIQKFGKTNLSDGQLKQALEQRSVKVAKLLEKDDEWHCFFLTYNSIAGKENWQNGQPHFHYISNLFNLDKTELIKQLKSKKL